MELTPEQDPQRVKRYIDAAIAEAERIFGPREPQWKMGEHFFGEEIYPELLPLPQISTVVIRLGKESRHNWSATIHEIGHECVHFLSPITRERGFNIEEGCACWLANKFYKREYGRKATVPGGDYARAFELVDKIMRINPWAIKNARAKTPCFADIESTTFLRQFATISKDDGLFLFSQFPYK